MENLLLYFHVIVSVENFKHLLKHLTAGRQSVKSFMAGRVVWGQQSSGSASFSVRVEALKLC